MSSIILDNGVEALYHQTHWYTDAHGNLGFDKKTTVGPFSSPAVTKVPINFPASVPGDATLDVISADLTIESSDPRNFGKHIYVSGPNIGGSLARKVNQLTIPCRLPLYHVAWDTYDEDNSVSGILGAIFNLDVWLPVLAQTATGVIDIVLNGITGKKKQTDRKLLMSNQDAIPRPLYLAPTLISGSVTGDLHFSGKGMRPPRPDARLGDLRNNDYTLYCLSDSVSGGNLLRLAPGDGQSRLSRRPGSGFWYTITVPVCALASIELIDLRVMSLQCDKDDPEYYAWTGSATTDLTHVDEVGQKHLFGDGAVVPIRGVGNEVGADLVPMYTLSFDFEAYDTVGNKKKVPSAPFYDTSDVFHLIFTLQYRAYGGGVET